MATEIVDLDALVPDDIEFHYRDKSYLLPGDPPNEVVLALVKHYNSMVSDIVNAEDGKEEDRTEAQIEQDVEQAVESTKALLLGLFQLADPELKTWPFGMYSTQHIARTVLVRLGLLRLLENEPKEEGDPPTTPTPKKPRARKPMSAS